MAKEIPSAKAAKKTVKAKTQKAPAKAKAASKKSAPKKKAASKPVAKQAQVKKGVAKKAEPTKVAAPVPAKPAATKSAPPQLGAFPMLTQRPIAHVKATKPSSGKDDRTRYSDEELKEFEKLILEKLEKAKGEYKILKDTLSRDNDAGTDATSGGNTKVLEDGAETAEKENLSQLAARQQKFITNLENALVRIKNGTYGICSVTGKLIPKERLIAVPHTTQSIEAKMMQQD